ncbi:lytic transglycosylase [Rhizobium rhizosphaerae]|uniref:Lytic transglycosylase n=1 Tax=Xaviernesmea rhizosphaerae TaxID=1672749 RepID=A0A1Q9AMC0_9HYPH|nr:lytic transglycosylase domain-containing protein [Xaviernesmea rhizosphaerae]OLP56522.1 lytic transglycosylase [Xaviernesmea rhizosphaerae]OQP87825.1 lytic transglycosylase [Xaviernesmea rhizosphaerae]
MKRSTVATAAACLVMPIFWTASSFAGSLDESFKTSSIMPDLRASLPSGNALKQEAPAPLLPDTDAAIEEPEASSPEIGRYNALLHSYARQYGVPFELAQAVVKVESNYNPKVRGSAGEIGLMQIKPATARMMGYSGGARGLFDPETNIKYGMKYLAGAHRLSGGFTCGTILRYNAGHGAKRMNPVSRRYCGRVQSIMDS